MILDDDHRGYYNMACDEVIFNSYCRDRIPTLRIYGWQDPFVTLGYFQKTEQVLDSQSALKQDIHFTRRITGGSAILHYAEITYSLSLAVEDLNLPKSPKASFGILTSFILNFYKNLGLESCFAKDIYPLRIGRYGNFCFSSCEEFDILINDRKIGGNAQKRKKNFIFQQGSIPLRIDFDLIRKVIKGTPEDLEKKTQGLISLRGNPRPEGIKNSLAASFKETFNIEFVSRNFYDEELESIEYLIRNKYKLDSWKFRVTSNK